ncbi:MAG: nitroreductase family protein [Methanomicrobiales archaeon]
MDSSEFLDLLISRTSVRDYTDEELAEDDIVFLLDSACTAPSAGNLEAWDVVVIRETDQKEALMGAAYDQPHISAAPVLFIVCANYVRSMSRYGERGILYAVQDATIACTYMMLAAHSRRLHSCWVGAFDEDGVRDILGLPPHIRAVALLTVGKGRPPGTLTGRMAVGEHVHFDAW